mmetsp:Transcript_2818/g.8105  ORF Transcript_2818/g.8105 Transcript_2818/m.8105 type:complete len:325 (+) Transcript_2818:1034-2008(+)
MSRDVSEWQTDTSASSPWLARERPRGIALLVIFLFRLLVCLLEPCDERLGCLLDLLRHLTLARLALLIEPLDNGLLLQEVHIVEGLEDEGCLLEERIFVALATEAFDADENDLVCRLGLGAQSLKLGKELGRSFHLLVLEDVLGEDALEDEAQQVLPADAHLLAEAGEGGHGLVEGLGLLHDLLHLGRDGLAVLLELRLELFLGSGRHVHVRHLLHRRRHGRGRGHGRHLHGLGLSRLLLLVVVPVVHFFAARLGSLGSTPLLLGLLAGLACGRLILDATLLVGRVLEDEGAEAVAHVGHGPVAARLAVEHDVALLVHLHGRLG